MLGKATFMRALVGTVGSDAAPDDYTVLLQIFSPFGIVIASSSKVITVTAP